MDMYNSAAGYSQEDDITIINPSILHGNGENEEITTTPPRATGYVPIATRFSSIGSTTSQTTPAQSAGVEANNYVFVDHDPHESAVLVKDVLMLYRTELRQEGNKQFDCDRQLINRLLDLIRPAFAQDTVAAGDLQVLADDLSSLLNKRHIDASEQLEQLHTEIYELKKMLLDLDKATSNDKPRSSDRTTSMNKTPMTPDIPLASGHDLKPEEHEQWTLMDDETKRLHDLVQTQRKQIDQLVSLISHEGTTPPSLSISKETIAVVDAVRNENGIGASSISPSISPSPTAQRGGVGRTLFEQLRAIVHGQEKRAEPELVPSPGTSPSHSLSTLVSRLSEDNEHPVASATPQSAEEEKDVEEHPLLPVAVIEVNRCPMCNEAFPAGVDEQTIYAHVDQCLIPSGNGAPSSSSSTQPKAPREPYECPNCQKKFPANDEYKYLQHLSDCYNRDIMNIETPPPRAANF